jgi:hypothetical protein
MNIEIPDQHLDILKIALEALIRDSAALHASIGAQVAKGREGHFEPAHPDSGSQG